MPISFDEIICKTSQMKTLVFKEILAFPTHLMLAQMIVCWFKRKANRFFLPTFSLILMLV